MANVDARQIKAALKKLKKLFPGPAAMEIGNAYQSLVAVILSARTRDEQVLKLLPGFFKAYPNENVLSNENPFSIEKKVNTIGMYKQKAKNLRNMAKMVVEVYGGKIPNTMEELIALPGVGRKTASVILAMKFKTPAIAVDTHVHRVTNRLGWVKTKTPAETERALLKIVPKDQMRTVNQVFVKHGRYICIANPRCWACPLVDVCKFKNKNLERPKNGEAILDDIERREQLLQNLRKNAV